MKTKIEIDVDPFPVPECVTTSGSERNPHRLFHLSELDADTLDKLCRDFRHSVFKIAKKSPPPQIVGVD